MFTEPFVQRALAVAALLGPLCALLGVFVTARRMAFLSDTVAHASLAGAALAFLVGMNEPTWIMMLVSLGVAGAVIWLKEHTRLLDDTIMALLLTGSVAIGTVIMSRLRGYRAELHRVLFGDILAVGPGELAVSLGLLALVAVGIIGFLSPLTLMTTSEDLARVCGVPVRGMNYVFVIVLTLTVTVSIRLVGIILVGALLVVPPATARNLSRNLRQEIWLSVGLGLFSGVGGVLVSCFYDLPCGPSIVLVSIAAFLVTLLAAKAGLPSRRTAAPA